jgi:hypothetical protein
LQGIVVATGHLAATCHATPAAQTAFFFASQRRRGIMPLFFIIAIGAGAFTLGATAVDVTSDTSAQNRERALQAEQVQPQQQTYATMADCQRAMAAQHLSAASCQQRS